MISNYRMQITLLSFLFKKFNIGLIKKGINIINTLKLYAVLFSHRQPTKRLNLN